ncbi:glutamine synthetase family protein [Paracoccus denitrificans]|jgi:glutamine synthetase|uniref:Glutamate--putrescine ligase n=1 Tax=Paracoccus denitrificans (strain Pd 1222) TaxID=318586 RepID=A1B8C5_PARDP|nr:glutamine synthetase family protein [Paracoccus denitrificans]ABL71769.1 glutamate--putrescine ligase [Paracoccus denitrificans PD1222]MBB4628134.1 glutamine synthetase [Paracoccus denitrificans]MCU7429199.1 glutamine synthetase family protein [Paracoccus denitrificans]QAR28359.1 glutamine synthetase [Paracoccus denitrificans]UPV98099.1 glutamine synthetase family protein [Paracoccus denitrificans]
MDWLHEHPDVKTIRIAAADLNGVARGKRVPARFADKILTEGTKFPFSVLNMDIWGEDIEDSPLVFQAGDPDGLLLPTERGFMPMPWLEAPTGLLPIWMFHLDGRPYEGDPRQALARVVERYKAAGLTPVVATELEFFLIDDSGGQLRVPPSPRSGKRRTGAETLSLRALDAFDRFFTALYDACEAMDIPADTAISEAAPGQFEINLMHQADPLKAADDAWLFKLLVKGLARRYGFAGSFMAKPYEAWNGSGMHMHFSVLDEQGRNVFDNGGEEGSEALRHAVAGCLAAMPGSTLLFAPHENSYDRLVPNAHAPTGIGWAYENRTSAIRIPSSGPKARRIEHRVAGGDVNPYLTVAAVLGAALNGIEDKAEPPPPIQGNAYELGLEQLPGSWGAAIDAFETSPQIKRIFPAHLIENFVMTKRQELHYMAELSDEETVELYLDTV